MERCNLCPRNCNAQRESSYGFCKSPLLPKVARADLHMWEEPCISGARGSGTVFFSGCSLKCVFCQNHEISHGETGSIISVSRLAQLFKELRDKGAHNINLVNPTHYAHAIIEAIDLVKGELGIPVVWNSSGYEKPETIRALSGYVDIFLPDFKYVSPEISQKYSGASDYFDYASKALSEMINIAGYPKFSDDGMLNSGVLVRHLVLPSHAEESIRVIDYLADNFDKGKMWISLMCQYFPAYRACEFREISRKLTTLEYMKVINHAKKKGLVNGFLQDRNSATEKYVPQFTNDI